MAGSRQLRSTLVILLATWSAAPGAAGSQTSDPWAVEVRDGSAAAPGSYIYAGDYGRSSSYRGRSRSYSGSRRYGSSGGYAGSGRYGSPGGYGRPRSYGYSGGFYGYPDSDRARSGYGGGGDYGRSSRYGYSGGFYGYPDSYRRPDRYGYSGRYGSDSYPRYYRGPSKYVGRPDKRRWDDEQEDKFDGEHDDEQTARLDSDPVRDHEARRRQPHDGWRDRYRYRR